MLSYLLLFSLLKAGGNQVHWALTGTGAVINTYVVNGSLGCSILETYQKYDSNGVTLFGAGYNVVLELKVQQVVYVSSSTYLTQTQVYDIVALGFNRGAGGRVQFRSLLRLNPSFVSITNVEVLSQLDSLQPSSAPSSRPSDSPTTLPTRGPSSSPTYLPSSRPSFAPTSASIATSADSSRLRRIIVGSVLGGIATVIIACIALLCLWYPICSPTDDSDDYSEHNKRAVATRDAVRRPFGYSDSEGSTVDKVTPANKTLTVYEYLSKSPIGSQVGVTADAASCSSLDESSVYTSGAYSEAASDKAMRDLFAGAINVSSMTGSVRPPLMFTVSPIDEGGDDEYIDSDGDEDSLPDSAVLFCDEDGMESDVESPAEATTTFQSMAIERLVVTETVTTNENFVANSSTPELYTDDAHRDTTREGSSPSLFQEATLGTKGFDPFLEEAQSTRSEQSSIFAIADQPSTLEMPVVIDERSQPSAASSKTSRVYNTAAYKARMSHLQSEEEKPETADDDDDAPENVERCVGVESVGVLGDLDAASIDASSASYAMSSDNSLLRSLLEDARRLSQRPRKYKSSRSRYADADAALPDDILADHQDFEDFKPYTRQSTMADDSVDSPPTFKKKHHLPRSSSLPPATKARVEAILSRRPLGMTKSAPSLAATGNFLDGYVSSQHHSGALDPATSFQVERDSFKSSSKGDSLSTQVLADLSSRSNSERRAQLQDETLVDHPDSAAALLTNASLAQARSAAMQASSTDSESDHERVENTAPSSAGVLGISAAPTSLEGRIEESTSLFDLDNPWLFDAIEQTLGPRSPTADMESISGRSVRSGRSNRSVTSQRSKLSNGSSSNRLPRTSHERKHQNRAAISQSSADESLASESIYTECKCDDEDQLAPRSLEKELKKIEVNLAIPYPDSEPTSSITASSADASRSSQSLSSRRLVSRRGKLNHIEVLVPAGKLGVVLADRRDGMGTFVAKVRPQSSMSGTLLPGDKLRKS
jgi:hypothetical protein